jgi:hypothetical protein
MNNLALFVTHHLFLTEEQITEVVSGRTVEAVGHCVPVWVDAKTGKTTEPASEVFCSYRIHNCREKSCDVDVVPKSGYDVYIPNVSAWRPPEDLDFEKMNQYKVWNYAFNGNFPQLYVKNVTQY